LLHDKHVALIGMSDTTALNFRKQLDYFGAKTSICRQASEINEQEQSSYDLVILPKQSVMLDNKIIAELLQNKPCILLQLFLTANQEQDFDAELDHEMLYYPYAPGQLLHAIKRSLAMGIGEPEASDSSYAQPDAEQITALRILAVEDNEINQYVLQAMLESLGCKANIANDGLQAIQQLNSSQYDVVLMDIEMPNMDGMQATYAIRKNMSIKQPYIIALTAHVMSDSRTKFMQAGMDDYISKPILIAGLESALHRASSAIHARDRA
jgi:CheY-like chemotaxis protein